MMSNPSFENPCQGRLIAGAHPRGSIHIGELTGAIESWVNFQDHYECIFIIADSERQKKPEYLYFSEERNSHEMLADWLAAGISPNYSIITRSSAVPEKYQLVELLRNSVGSNIWLPKESDTQFFCTIDAIEMLLFKVDAVPQKEGQSLDSLVTAQNLAIKFNQKYGAVFPIVKPLTIPGKHLLGLDGQPMQRSFSNLILLKEFDEETEQKISSAAVDTLVMYAVCFDPDQNRAISMIENFYDNRLSLEDLRHHVTERLNDYLHSIRIKRDKWIAIPDVLESILQVGARRARAIALETLAEVKDHLRRPLISPL